MGGGKGGRGGGVVGGGGQLAGVPLSPVLCHSQPLLPGDLHQVVYSLSTCLPIRPFPTLTLSPVPQPCACIKTLLENV